MDEPSGRNPARMRPRWTSCEGLAKRGKDTPKLIEGELAEWREGVTIETIDEAFVYEVQPRKGMRVLCVEGALGCGQTTQLSARFEKMKYLPAFEGQSGKRRILVITPRPFLTQSLKRMFPGITHYSRWSEDRLKDDWQLTCLNSLHRLVNERPFEEIYIQASRLCMDALTCVAQDHLADNYDLLRALIEQARLTIFADCEPVDGAVRHFVQTIDGLRPHEIHVQRCKARFARVFRCTNPAKWESALDEALALGERVAVPCRTRVAAEILHKVYSLQYSTKLYTSDTPHTVLERDMDVELQGIQLLLYTSKVALDITTLFDRVFVHAWHEAGEAGGAGAVAFAQCCAGTRNLANKDILMVVELRVLSKSELAQEQEDCAHAFDEALLQLQDRAKYVRDLIATNMPRWRAHFEVHGYPRPTPDHLTELCAYTQAAERRPFLAQFERLVLAQGGQFHENRVEEWSGAYLSAREAVKQEAADDLASAIRAVGERGAQAIIDEHKAMEQKWLSMDDT